MAHNTIPYSQETTGKKFLVIGDSLAYGVGASSGETSFAGQLAAKFPDASIDNKAAIGEDVAGLTESIPKAIDHYYDSVFIIIGGNDIARYGVDLDKSIKLLADLYGYASRNAGKVYVYTTIRFSEVSALPVFVRWYFNQRSIRYRDGMLSAADLYKNVEVIDAFYVNADEYDGYEASDGFHLNDAGIARLIGLTFPGS